MKWTENKIAASLARQVFDRRNLVMVPNCSWTGSECDLLVVTSNLRIIDVEIKISRSDFKADAKKEKWWEHWRGDFGVPKEDRKREPLGWPRKVWKHYYAMPKEIWKPDMAEFLPSKNCGVILLNPIGSRIFSHVERRAIPCRDAEPISAAAAVGIARLASMRMWDAFDKLEAVK